MKIILIFLLKKIKISLSQICKELLFLARIWRPEIERKLDEAQKFSNVNSSFWTSKTQTGCEILVEGHLSEYGPNYLFRTALAAKAVQEKIGGKIVVVVNSFSHIWQTAILSYGSFGIDKWIFLGSRFLLIQPFLFAAAYFCSFIQMFRLRNPENIVDLKLWKLKAGDLIYDEVLRANNISSIESIDWNVFNILVRSWTYYFQYELVFKLGNYSYYISTHTCYPQYGLLCRVALKHRVKVIETTDIQNSAYDKIDEKHLPTYHHGIKTQVSSALNSNAQKLKIRENRAKISLAKRINSEIKQIDAQKAYSGKVYTKEIICRTLGIDTNNKIGIVAAHIFKDSPHLSPSMIFRDYYKWLVKSLDYCAQSKKVHWIVKPHPSCKYYGEDGLIDDLVRSKGVPNIHMCPTDMNTSSIRDFADVILTVHGTVGLEYACFGIPSIIAGTPFYSGFGFTHDPSSSSEYYQMVLNASDIPKLSEKQISKALQVYDIWNQVFDWHNPIITEELLSNVWGSDVQRNVCKAYEILTNNLKENDPKKLKLWRFVFDQF